jgi:hypothetical protein
MGIRMAWYNHVHRQGGYTDHHREDMVLHQARTALHQAQGFTDLCLEYMVHHQNPITCNYDLDPTPNRHTHPKVLSPMEDA